ncbi:MAG TPA: SDR family NAD(P)-dependent oxidoreductase [Sphingobium sp.]
MDQSVSALRSVKGRVALVTGAGSGIGRATALLFAGEGAHVAMADIDGDAVRETAAMAEDCIALPFALDITDGDAVEAAVAQVVERWGGVDILVNNAGISTMIPIDDPAYEAQWDRHVAVLLTAQIRLVRAALPHLRRSDAARIVNIASTEALGATAGLSAYSAAKAGVVGLTRSLAVELGREGITVNCICPGPIDTGMTAAIPDEQKARYAASRTALRRYGTPDELAHMILSFALPAASYLTGAVVPVDGGLMARNG